MYAMTSGTVIRKGREKGKKKNLAFKSCQRKQPNNKSTLQIINLVGAFAKVNNTRQKFAFQTREVGSCGEKLASTIAWLGRDLELHTHTQTHIEAHKQNSTALDLNTQTPKGEV